MAIPTEIIARTSDVTVPDVLKRLRISTNKMPYDRRGPLKNMVQTATAENIIHNC